MSTTFSVQKLEKLLRERNKQLDGWEKQRDKLQAQLDKLDAKIAKAKGTSTEGRRSSRAASQPRLKNDKTLKQHVAEVLSKGPLKLADITEGVLSNGYKTRSDKFKNVIYQILYHNDEFVHGKDGNWSNRPTKAKAVKKSPKRRTKKKVVKKKATAKA